MPEQPIELPPDTNVGLNPIGAPELTAIFGKPRTAPLPPHSPGGPCFAVTNRRLSEFIVKRRVPFLVEGLQPAVDLLADVLDEIKQINPGLHSRLGTAGMLCVRRIAGKTTTSNHAWGTAVDITVDNITNIVGNDLALPGLIEIAPVFNRHGWFWGAEFPDEDSMHFDISREKMDEWERQGRFTRDPILQRGHVGVKVAELQTLLNSSDVAPSPPLVVDRDFGAKTLAAVNAFQTAKQLVVDGIVGIKTWAALRA